MGWLSERVLPHKPCSLRHTKLTAVVVKEVLEVHSGEVGRQVSGQTAEEELAELTWHG